MFDVMRKKDSRVATLQKSKLDCVQGSYSEEYPGDLLAFEDLGVHECWSEFKNSLYKHRDRQFQYVKSQTSRAEASLAEKGSPHRAQEAKEIV